MWDHLASQEENPTIFQEREVRALWDMYSMLTLHVLYSRYIILDGKGGSPTAG
jgi:hypothetical protein